MNLHQVAHELDKAAAQATATQQISTTKALKLEEAYAVQTISIGRRILRGEKLRGMKLGFTSKAKMEQMGVHDMIWGQLTNKMEFTNGSAIGMGQFIHPRAEPEIAFRFSQDITEPIDLENVRSIIDGIAVAIEIIDSRYENFKFSLEDVVADNCSSSGFLLGDWLSKDANISNKNIQLIIDEEVVQEGNSNAILGNPLESIVNAVRLALAHGIQLKKNDILLAGAATSAVYLKHGQTIKAIAEGLGEVSFTTA